MLRGIPLATLYIKAYAMSSGVTNDKHYDVLLRLKEYLYNAWIWIPCIDTHVADTILNETRLLPMHRRIVTPLELADRTAKAAPEEALQQNLDVTLSYPEAKSFVRKATNNQWQELWNRANAGRHLHQYRPSITSKSYRSFHSKSGESKLNRVLLGHTRLKSHLQNIGIEDNNSCDCGKGIEDIEHVLLQCQLYSNQRDILESTVYSIYHRYNIGFHLQRFGVYSLLAPDTSIPLRARDEITAAVISFWSTAGCNI